MTTLALTLARRRCARCERNLGLALWPWSGHWFVTTHSLCDACFALHEREVRAADRRRRKRPPRASSRG